MGEPDRPDLVGWKAIADALGVCSRTAQRWVAHGLPIFAHGPWFVAAHSSELHAWARKRRNVGAAA